jgi:hypothetical protein
VFALLEINERVRERWAQVTNNPLLQRTESSRDVDICISLVHSKARWGCHKVTVHGGLEEKRWLSNYQFLALTEACVISLRPLTHSFNSLVYKRGRESV